MKDFVLAGIPVVLLALAGFCKLGMIRCRLQLTVIALRIDNIDHGAEPRLFVEERGLWMRLFLWGWP